MTDAVAERRLVVYRQKTDRLSALNADQPELAGASLTAITAGWRKSLSERMNCWGIA